MRPNSLDDLYESNLSAPPSPVPPSRLTVAQDVQTSEQASNEMLIDEDPIDLTEPDFEVTSTTKPAESKPALPAPDNTVTTTKTLARIAFLGLPERFDEWIELSSDRLQKIDSCSFGRRGKLVSVRDEIVFLAKLVPSAQGEIGKFAIFREGCFAQPLYIHLVNWFGAHSGFGIIEEKLRLAAQKVAGVVEVSDTSTTSSSAAVTAAAAALSFPAERPSSRQSVDAQKAADRAATERVNQELGGMWYEAKLLLRQVPKSEVEWSAVNKVQRNAMSAYL